MSKKATTRKAAPAKKATTSKKAATKKDTKKAKASTLTRKGKQPLTPAKKTTSAQRNAAAKAAKKKANGKSPRMVVREARSDADYHRAYPIIHQLFPHLDMQTYARRVFVARATGYRMFVAQIGGEVVGVIGIMPNHNIHDGFVTYIEHVVVEESHRGQGYGAQLIKFAESRAMEEGCKLLELDTDIGAEDAERLYQRNGFYRSGSYYSKNIDLYKDS